MLWVILSPVVAGVSVLITFFISDQSRWRKVLLVIGIAGVIVTGVLGYNNRERVTALQAQVAQLKTITAGRQITPGLKESIRVDLKPFAGQKVFITSYSGDAEAARLALAIKATLESAGVGVYNHIGRTTAGPGGIVSGIALSGLQTDNDFLRALAKAIGRDGTIQISDDILPPGITMEDNTTSGIIVGIRPQ